MDGVDILRRTPCAHLDVLIVTAGPMAVPALEAAALLEERGIGVTVADPRWILPVNPFLAHLAARHRLTVTVEDAITSGGLGAALTQAVQIAARGRPGVCPAPVLTLGIPTAFVDHGERGDLLAAAGLTGPGIVATVLETYVTRLA